MLRVPPSGTWERRRADLFGLAEDRLGPPPQLSHEDALEHLVRRYLAGFGPATRADVAGFAGIPLTAVSRALKGMELRRFRSTHGAELLDVPRAPLPDPDTPAPPRFLPVWDATLLVHARRTQILPERYRSRVFSTRRPHGTPTFLIDGAVAGEWRYEDGKVALEPYERLTRGARAALREEAHRLAGFHA
jgi:DNA glycosylase AlkZ-like